MMPKIMLFNYTEAEATIVSKQTGLRVIRGYVSEGHLIHQTGGDRTEVKYYSPEPFYECAMVFVKLPAKEVIENEFDGKSKELTPDVRKSFQNYWRRAVFVVFVGDTNLTNLISFGIPLRLINSSGNDTAPYNCFGQRNEISPLVQALTEQINMPTSRYLIELIQPKNQNEEIEMLYYNFGSRYYPYICNANNDILAGALSRAGNDYSGEEPGALVTGLPKTITTTTVKIIEFLGNHYEIYTPGVNWKESNSLYPQKEIIKLENEIHTVEEKAKAEIEIRNEKIKTFKDKWKYLPSLVTDKGTLLVDAVYLVFKELIELKVSKSDPDRPADPIEDLLIDMDDKTILIEVKGTKASNPPLDYPQQALTHILRRGLTGNVEAGLVVNHNMQIDPLLRNKPYATEESQRVINGIYYIDTRTLLKIAVAIIDNKLSPDQAKCVLFGKLGRVEYESN